MKALFYVHVFVSGGRQLCSLLYPACQIHLVCRVHNEEEVQDYGLFDLKRYMSLIITHSELCTLFAFKSEDNPRNIRVQIKRQFEEMLYSTLFFKEIIYLCERVDNRIVKVARPRIRFKNKQSTAII